MNRPSPEPVILKFPTLRMRKKPREIDHQAEQAAHAEQLRAANLKLLRSVFAGDLATHAQCRHGARKKPPKKTQTHQREIARRKKGGAL